ncbi:MAG TPA: LuxR C-terminal-related transcriptional regulator [Macromonas sp.]|nr:LuxR C-terminal-related transcriptional regulator [Macromonas sp.]
MFQCLETVEPLPAKVLSIVAPVGYGKTVLMSQLFAELRKGDAQCLWYALDDRDSSIDALVAFLESQLRHDKTHLHPTQALLRGNEPIGHRIEAVMRLIEGHAQPLTIFFDNLDHCADPALGNLLDRLVFYGPPSLHLVLSSTRDIPLDLSRAQLQGLLRRIGPLDLAFSGAEIVDLLGPRVCEQIGPAGVEDVTRRTEGWPAAVRMMQIVLSNSSQPAQALASFSGSDETLAHLLNRQVLAGFTGGLRDFLFCVAQLRSFNLDLCRTAVQLEGVEQHLAYLVEHNVFVIALDRNRDWYRLHGLFRDFLLREAQRQLPAERLKELRVRAARWCEQNGHWHDAVEYALASGDAETAVEILERLAPILVRDLGHIPQYLDWIEQLRAQGCEPGPEAEYWNVWALAFHRRAENARKQAKVLALRIERMKGKRAAEVRTDLLRRTAILKAAIDSLCDHLFGAYESMTQWLAQAGSTPDDPFNLTAANSLISYYHNSMYHFVEARPFLQKAREYAYQTGSMHAKSWVQTYGVLGQIYEGDFESAYRDTMTTLTEARQALGESAGICGTLSLAAAKCAVEMGRQNEARELLASGFRTVRTHGFLDVVACGLEAAVLLWRGEDDGAVSLDELREIAACYPPRLSYMLSCFLIQRLAVLGRAAQAAEMAERIGLFATTHMAVNAPGAEIAYMAALVEDTAIALMCSGGRLTQAEHAIEQALRGAKAANCVSRQVVLLLAAAQVAHQSGQAPVAIRQITRAISLAAPRQLVRPFNDHTATLAAVVADTRPNAWGFATDQERQFFAERCRTLSFSEVGLHERMAVLQDEPFLASKLTARELELLRFIEAGLSNKQIADRLEVAVTTVKWHLQNLFAKLSVSNRSAALARARSLNLL